LGFSSDLFQYYIDPTTNSALGEANVVKTAKGRTWIILPQIKALVSSYFGCPNPIGAALENDGG